MTKAGSLHEFVRDLHAEYGPIVSFWMGKEFTVSIASPELFKEVAHLFDRPGKAVSLSISTRVAANMSVSHSVSQSDMQKNIFFKDFFSSFMEFEPREQLDHCPNKLVPNTVTH